MIDEVGITRDRKYLLKVRKILNDYKTPDQRIYDRIDYLETFCRKIIRIELEKYAQKKHNGNKKSY